MSGALQHDAGLGVLDPVRLAAFRHQPSEEQERDHHDDQPAGEPEQEPERPVERADPAVEDGVGNLDGDHRNDDQGAEKQTADHHALGDDVVGDVALRKRHCLGIEIDGDGGSGDPRRDGKNFAHEAANHREQRRDQHDREKNDIEQRDHAGS